MLAQEPSYPRRDTTNGLSPIIMNEVFNFPEKERYNLGIHLTGRNMNTAHFSTGTISTIMDAIIVSLYLAQIKRHNKIGQGFKNIISNFACFLTAIVSV